jgi:hypothetical protein
VVTAEEAFAEISAWVLPFTATDGTIGWIKSSWDLAERSRVGIEIHDIYTPYVASARLESGRVVELQYRAKDGERLTHRLIRATNLITFCERWAHLVEAKARAYATGDLLTAQRLEAHGLEGRSPTEILDGLEAVMAEHRSTTRRKRVRGEEAEHLLRKVVDEYKEALKDKDPRPRVTVGNKLGYTPEHIGRLLVKARRMDPPLLGPAMRGKAGEESP